MRREKEESAVPCRVRDVASRASPQARDVGSRGPLPGSRAAVAAASPAQRDPEGRPRPRGGAGPGEGRGQGGGGAVLVATV